MGEMAQRIVKLDVGDLVKILNEAFAEEWLAYYQYWIGARIGAGQMRPSIVEEFKKHAKEEREHCELLADRIIQLGGTPLINPDDWSKLAKCKYDAPVNENIRVIVEQILDSERCAIGRYQGICDMCCCKDFETFRISAFILSQEIDHEQDMEDFLKDMKIAKEYFEKTTI